MPNYRYCLGFLVLFLPLALFGFNDPEEGEGDGAFRRIFITYSGSYSAVRVYIRAQSEDSYRYHGRIRRERARSFRLRGGRTYLIRLRHGRYRSVKRVYLPRSNDREVVFFAPNITGITVTLRGNPAWAKLFINGEGYGKIFRGKPKQVELASGRVYTIRVSRGEMVRTRRVRLRSRGPGRHRRVTLFLTRE